ncbi:hypothetical protein IV56_GL000896 [Lacticaseibacillus saniviri JCM 17471 = DSM 24301]|uniref:Uncharacterized protein n=2 Tax=Lacticaseibacillus saniviri TaxID=931533 RepID=A0A0R2MYZ8_9LACO|nr:hypothetical protein IV56_GL000896 [Lacticaseibacillus saniviri JCM 17471 = DSM 24301]
MRMQQQVFVVFYADLTTVRLIRVFQSEQRAQAYVKMLQKAPFDHEAAEGYRYQMVPLN